MKPAVAFYAPLKSPNHPQPSGDRTMARLLMAALEGAGFAPVLASELRSFEPTGDPDRQRAIREAARAEMDSVVSADQYRATTAPFRIWLTYHPYYKSPDWIGPAVASRLGIPYVAVEASRADKRASGAFAEAHEAIERALACAKILFAMTPQDRDALERRRPPGQRILDLPPFLDTAPLGPAPVRRPRTSGEPVRLLCVAMMRVGDKLASYRLLAEALRLVPDANWTLDVVGDGPERAEIHSLLSVFAPRIRFFGRVDDPEALGRIYAEADLFVWPAVNEAYGMVLLEAQAMGCPVLAGDYGGVASAVQAGLTGELAPPGDAAAFARQLAALMADPARWAAMSAAASRFVREERSLEKAAAILRPALLGLLPESAAA